MMGIAPIFFWFARLCLRQECVIRCTPARVRMVGRQGLQVVSEPRFQNVVLPKSAKVLKATTREYSASGRFDRNHPYRHGLRVG